MSAPVTTPLDTSSPAGLRGHMCFGAASGADTAGRNTHRGRAETTAEPRDCTTKEEEQKSLLMATRTIELHLHWWLLKFSACRTSQRTKGAPAAAMGLALAAVGFVGMFLWGLSETRVWDSSIAHTAGPGSCLLQSRDLTSVNLCQWSGEDNTWESSGPVAGIPTVKVGSKAVPITV